MVLSFHQWVVKKGLNSWRSGLFRTRLCTIYDRKTMEETKRCLANSRSFEEPVSIKLERRRNCEKVKSVEAVGYAERCRQGWWPSSEFVPFTQSRLSLLDSCEVRLPSLNIDFYWKVGNRARTGMAEACYLSSSAISVKGGRFRIFAVLDVSSRFRSSRAQFYNSQKLRGLPIYSPPTLSNLHTSQP